jgi:hypothetical protein
MLDRRSGIALSLWRSASGTLRFSLDEREGPSVVVLSMPKAGTYMIAALLEAIGWANTGVHLSDHELTDYRGLTTAEQRGEYQHLMRSIPLYLSAGMVGDGQFTVGHLSRTNETVRCLRPLKKVFLFREIRAALVSICRFQVRTGRGGTANAPWRTIADPQTQLVEFLKDFGAAVMPTYTAVVNWIDDPDVLPLSFESVMGDHGDTARKAALVSLCRFLGREVEDIETVFVQSVLNRETKTWSGARSTLAPYWSDAAENLLVGWDAIGLNRRLGYADLKWPALRGYSEP